MLVSCVQFKNVFGSENVYVGSVNDEKYLRVFFFVCFIFVVVFCFYYGIDNIKIYENCDEVLNVFFQMVCFSIFKKILKLYVRK